MGLSNYQLVLLDNLIYLDTIVEGKRNTVGDVIKDLLYKDGNPNNTSEYGTIVEDCKNAHSGSANCMMELEDWVKVLQAIEADPLLCDLQIHNVEDTGKTGFRAATFISEEEQENVIIFRGTSTANEWIDNAEGGYLPMTNNQSLALDYVNNLDVVNNYSFVTSGHSKGGNLATFVTLFSEDTLIDRCLSFDGQGFSKELYESDEYKQAISKRGNNMYLVASSCDYVNVLFNSAVPDSHKMYLDANGVGLNVPGYHRPDNIFSINENGSITGLNGAVQMSVGSYFIKDFIGYITETETDPANKAIVYNGLMSLLAASADNSDDMKIVTGALGIQLLIDVGVSVLVQAVLTRFGVPREAATAVVMIGGKAFDMDAIDELLSIDAYKGEGYELFDSGAVDLLAGYMTDYINARTNNMFALVGLINDNISVDIVGSMDKLTTIMQNRMWEDMLAVFESGWNYTLEDLNKELMKTDTEINTRGERTKGNIYIEENAA